MVEPAALLDAWVKQHAASPAPPMRRFFVPSVRAEGLFEKIAHVFAAHDADYAITHEAAAQRYAPFLSAVSRVRCRLLAGQIAEQALRELDARVVREGMNLAVIEVKSLDELLFRNQLDGVWLASPVQVYLDLAHGEGRTKELADHLRRERIGFLMAKPPTITGYSTAQTLDCERILITLLRGLGPWKESIFLVGGLTPRYLVPAKPPAVEHMPARSTSTLSSSYRSWPTPTVITHLRKICAGWGLSGRRTTAAKKSPGAGRSVPNEASRDTRTASGRAEIAGGKVRPLPTDGQYFGTQHPARIHRLRLHQTTAVQAELLDGAGIATEKIKHANLVSFTCLKAFAYDDRIERKTRTT